MIKHIRLFAPIITLSLFACQPEQILSDPGPQECQNAVKVDVWADLNGNAVRDPDEPPLEEVQVRLVPSNDPTSDTLESWTGPDGRAIFPTRALDDCNPENYDAIFLVEVPGYQFPADPVVNLKGFDPTVDIVEFGLLPVAD